MCLLRQMLCAGVVYLKKIMKSPKPCPELWLCSAGLRDGPGPAGRHWCNSWLCRAEIGNVPPQLRGTVPGESRASSLPQGFSSAPKSTSVLMLWGEHCRDRIQGQSKAKGYGEINPEPNTVLQGTSKAATHRLGGERRPKPASTSTHTQL